MGWFEHEASAPLEAEIGAAIATARATLLPLGYRLEEPTAGTLVARGPFMQSTRQAALAGARDIRLEVTGGTIRLHAALGGVKSMTLFILLFPPALAVLLAGQFALFGHRSFVPFLAVSPWLVLSPVAAWWMRARTVSALEVLLGSMSSAR